MMQIQSFKSIIENLNYYTIVYETLNNKDWFKSKRKIFGFGDFFSPLKNNFWKEMIEKILKAIIWRIINKVWS